MDCEYEAVMRHLLILTVLCGLAFAQDQLPVPIQGCANQSNVATCIFGRNVTSGNGVMYYNSSVKIGQITDGTSNTLLAGERYSKDPLMQDSELSDVRGWAWTNYNSGEDHLGDTSWPMNSQKAVTGADARKNNFGSGHTGGANFLLCDGSVRFLSTSFSSGSGLVNWQRLSVPNDGHPVTLE